MLTALEEEIPVLGLGDVDAATAAADDHTAVRLAGPEAGVMPRLAPGNHAEERRTGIAPRVGALLKVRVALKCQRIRGCDWRHPPGDL